MRSPSRLASLLALHASVALAGCSSGGQAGGSPTPAVDAGDAALDGPSPVDASQDQGMDVAIDDVNPGETSIPDVLEDVARDAVEDPSTDAAGDAGWDGPDGAGADALPDGEPDVAPDGHPNTPPVALADGFSCGEDAPLIVDAANGVLANDTDADGDALSALVGQPPSHGTLTLRPDGSFDYVPVADFHGLDQFTYVASDGADSSGEVAVSLDVEPVNDAPVASSDSFEVYQDNTLVVPAPGVLGNDTDVEGDTLGVVGIVQPPASGVASIDANGALTYTPDPGTFGVDTVRYEVSDGALSSQGLVTIDVRETHAVKWARSAGAFGTDRAAVVTGRPDGSVVVGGQLHGASQGVVFGSGEVSQTTVKGNMFIAAFTADGALLWAKGIAAGSFSAVTDLDVYADGSVVVTGEVAGDAIFGAGEANQTTLTSTVGGGKTMFAARYHADGALGWVRQAHTYPSAPGRGIAALSDGSCVVVLECYGTTTFDQDGPNETSLLVDGTCLARYDAAGQLLWARGVKATGTSRIARLSGDDVVVTTQYFDAITLGAGEAHETTLTGGNAWNTAVARYDGDGSLVWAVAGKGPIIPSSTPYGLEALSDDRIVLTGTWWGQVVWGEGEPNATSLDADSLTTYLAVFAPHGALESATSGNGGTALAVFPDDTLLLRNQTVRGARRQALAGDVLWTIAIDAIPPLGVAAGGDPLLAGAFKNTLVLGAGTTTPISLTSANADDMFVARYAP